MIHKINNNKSNGNIKYKIQGPVEKSYIGYVVCTDASNSVAVTAGTVYALSRDAYLSDGEYFVDIRVDGSTLHGLYLRRFEYISEEEAYSYYKCTQNPLLSALGDFK